MHPLRIFLLILLVRQWHTSFPGTARILFTCQIMAFCMKTCICIREKRLFSHLQLQHPWNSFCSFIIPPQQNIQKNPITNQGVYHSKLCSFPASTSSSDRSRGQPSDGISCSLGENLGWKKKHFLAWTSLMLKKKGFKNSKEKIKHPEIGSHFFLGNLRT